MEALEQLRARLAELADLEALEMLASWDQLVMMPSEGAPSRAHQLGTLAGIAHERARAQEIGSALAEVDEGGLAALERDIVRLARRDWERAVRVPDELAAERSRASAEGQERWRVARERDDFALFAPALERNLALARAYGECLVDGHADIYEALLWDYDFGLRTADLSALFGALGRELPAIAAEARVRSPRRGLSVPVEAQRAAVMTMLHGIGVRESSWRVDVSAHPFTVWTSRRDTRLTTRYSDGSVESLLSSLHEYGHGLYERQIDPELERTNLGRGTSMSMHESQSKLWENHVARDPNFGQVLARELRQGGFAVAPADLRAALVGVEPGPIRVTADPLTYPLHIILRFELELAMVAGSLPVRDLPGAWREGAARLLGIEVPSDTLGCLQDIHWGGGSFGYFPSYALGCLIAAQLWETLEAELGPRGENLARGDVTAIQEWLGERVHRHGRRLDTIPLLEQVTGRGLETEPFLRYVAPLAEG